MPRVLIADSLSPAAVDIFRQRGVDVDIKTGLSKDELIAVIGDYDGLVVRSDTKPNKDVIAAAKNLKVIGRAGIGVDNIDIPAATAAGVVVMNTPFGNSITTAEHAIAMMFALARQLPAADASTQAGKWEKSRFMGVEKVELDDLLARADFITLHTPLTDKTRNILSAGAIARCKPGVRIINCARGGLVDEVALAAALTSGHVAGAAFDVFAEEPATASPLFNLPNVVVTPHLGAATTEAQENVALQVAGQMADYLLTGAVQNALNMPSVTAEEAAVMGPWVRLAGHLGAFVGQMTDEPIKAINVLFDGTVGDMNLAALNCATIAGIMQATNPAVNMVSAPVLARERGIQISTTRQEKTGAFDAYIKLTVVTDTRERSVAGTCFSDGKPRFIQIKGINIDAEVGRHMLYTTNNDVPGIIGTLGMTMGQNGVNIANFTLGRSGVGKDAIAILYLDQRLDQKVVDALEATGLFQQVKPLEFDVA